MRKNDNAISPVVSIALVLMIVVSSTATIVLWGVPYVQKLESESRKENTNMQFASIADSINELAGSTPGDRKTNPIDVYGGTLQVEGYKNRDRNIIWYSLDRDHNFTVTGLNPGNCFLAGTKVLMADGSYKNIEDVEIGDLVLSYEVETGKTLSCRVSKIFSHLSEEMTYDHYLLINNVLRVTPNHEFYSNGKWVEAGDLKVEDNLFTKTQNKNYVIQSIDKIYKKEPSYDLQVEQCHNYFVSIDDGVDVLVHNDNDPPTGYVWATPDLADYNWRWVDEEKAKDDIDSTKAYYDKGDVSGWTIDPLILCMSTELFPCKGFRILAKYNTGLIKMEINMHDNNDNLIESTVFSEWNDAKFEGKWTYYNYSSNINIKKVKIWFQVINNFGANSAEVYEFDFKVPIPECKIFDATEVTETSAKLNGQVTNDQGLDTCYYWFEYGTSESVLNHHTSSSGKYGLNDYFSEVIPNLVPAEVYYFRARLKHHGVENYWYTEANKPFITKPYPPSNIQLNPVTNNSISYSWTESQHGNDAIIKTKVLAKTVGWPTGPEDATADKWYNNLTGSSDTETNLTPGQRYNVSMWSWGQEGTLGRWSNRIDLTFYTKPDEITNLNALDKESKIELSWNKGSGANKTVIRRSTRGYPDNPTSGIEIYNDTGTTYFDTNVEPVENYYYSSWAYDSESGYFSEIYKTAYVQRVHQLAVTSPWVGDKWRAGTTHIITWAYGSSYKDNVTKIVLFGKNIGTRNWEPIIELKDKINISNKSFIWWIPTTMTTGEYKINISEINGDFYNISAVFYIEPLLDNIIDNVTIDLSSTPIGEGEQRKIILQGNTWKGKPIKDEYFYLQMIKGRTTRLDIYWLSNTDDISKGIFSLNGTICIFLYDLNLNPPPEGGEDVYFGNIWIFDSDSLMYESPSSSGMEKVIIEYGGIINSEQNLVIIKQKPTNIYEAPGFLSIHAVQTIASNLSSASGRRCSVFSNLKINSDIEQGDEKVYNLKIQFYGDNTDIWLNYFVENFMFDNTGDYNTLYYVPSNPDDGVRLSFAHSFIELKIS